MKLSVIIPCHPTSRKTLPRTLQSIDRAASRLELERIVVADDSSRGLSWARNRGLERANGDVVFFVDADDTVRPEYFSRLSELLEQTKADFALSSFSRFPLKRDYNLEGNAAIREALLPAFFGYSFDDVRRWNSGGRLEARREMGSVCRCAFRRDFIERNQIRFDEDLRLFEDAPFMSECAARATRVASTDEVLYDYEPQADGLMQSSLGTQRYWDYKFIALKNRQAIAARVGGEIMKHFAASAVFSLVELFKARKDWRRYAQDGFVGDALRNFPRSIRHPLMALAVTYLRTRIG